MLCAACSSLLLAGELPAQLRAGQTVAGFEFNLSNPGARSLALGGAFAGVADDATAAYSNPAGLVILVRPEVSLETRRGAAAVDFRIWESTKIVKFTPAGGLVLGVQFDTVELASRSSLDDVSFASWAQPYRRWAFALYAHQLANVRGEVSFSGDALPFNSLERDSSVLVDVKGAGLSAAYRCSDLWSIGATVVYYDGSARVAERESIARTGRLRQERSALIDDTDIGYSLGVLYRQDFGLSAGAYYRSGPRFAVTEQEVTPGRPLERRTASPLQMPSSMGLGFGYRFDTRVMVSAEWSRVKYSNLDRISSLPTSIPDDRLTTDDADEIRFGFEYSFWDLPAAPALRLGVWFDPEHALEAPEPTSRCPGHEIVSETSYQCLSDRPIAPEEIDPFVAAASANGFRRLFPGERDVVHLAAGIGLILGPKLQVDIAADYADESDYSLSFSMVAKF